VRLGAALDLLGAEREPGAGEGRAHHREVPGVGVARRVAVDLLDRNHVAPEDHGLEVEPAAVGQQVGDVREELAVYVLLATGLVVLGLAELLEGAEARHRVEWAEGVAGDLAGVLEVHVEPVAVAGLHLRRGQGDADAGGPGAADGVEQRTPPATEVEHAPARLEPDLLRHVLVLAPLGLLEGEREVTVVLRSAEIGEFAQAEPDDLVGQRVAEVEVLAPGHEARR